MGLRLIFILVAVVLVFWVLRRLRQRTARPPQHVASQDMVRCAHCGLHVPKTEATRDGDTYFCSAEHRDKGATS